MEQFGSRQLEVLAWGLQSIPQLTCSDARAIVQSFKYTHDQKEAIELVYPKLVDRRNISLVISVLAYETDREELMAKYNAA